STASVAHHVRRYPPPARGTARSRPRDKGIGWRRAARTKTGRPAGGVPFSSGRVDQADGLASGLVSGLVTGLDVSGLATTGGVGSRPGVVLLEVVEQAPTARAAA